MVAPVPYDMTHLVYGGTIAGSQKWSIGFWLYTPLSGAWGLPNQATWTASLRALGETWWGSVMTIATADTVFLTTATYLYLAGDTTAAQVATATPSTGYVGTGTVVLPAQTSLVATLRTAVAGRSYRGRLYFPMTGGALTTGHQTATAKCDSLATATKTLIDGINALVPTGGNPPSVRVSVRSGAGGGHSTPVTQVAVNSLPDTQRRRTGSILPSYTATATIT